MSLYLLVTTLQYVINNLLDAYLIKGMNRTSCHWMKNVQKISFVFNSFRTEQVQKCLCFYLQPESLLLSTTEKKSNNVS